MDESSPRALTKIRIFGNEKDRVNSLLKEYGFNPVQIIDRSDGNVTFDMGYVECNRQLELLNIIPKKCFALKASIQK